MLIDGNAGNYMIRKKLLLIITAAFKKCDICNLEIISEADREFVNGINVRFLSVNMVIHAANRPVFVNVVLGTEV